MLKSARPDRGFTIIEALIVTTLIAAGMAIAMVSISNRLRQENFDKGIGLFTTTVNDVFNDVATNNWQAVDGWECWLPSTSVNLEFRQKAGHQTGDGDCLYIGKVIQFGDDRKVTEDDGQYYVHTILTHKNALIPIYNFDQDIAPLDGNQSQPLATLEKRGTSGFSGRDSKAWLNGIQVNQAFYYDSSAPPRKIYIQGLAIVQLAGHGLTDKDLLLQSGASHTGIRVVRNQNAHMPWNPNQLRTNPDNFADSLHRIPWNNHSGSTKKEIDNFNLPIYICLSDGKGNRALGLIGGGSAGLLVKPDFDEAEINNHC